MTATGVRVAPTNVIVMSVDYDGGVGVEGSYAQLVGHGPVEIFSDGRLQKGTWFRRNIRLRTAYRIGVGQGHRASSRSDVGRTARDRRDGQRLRAAVVHSAERSFAFRRLSP